MTIRLHGLILHYIDCNINKKQRELRNLALSTNILRAGNKLPMQSSFFKNSAGDLLSALRILGERNNFCYFEIIFLFNAIHDDM